MTLLNRMLKRKNSTTKCVPWIALSSRSIAIYALGLIPLGFALVGLISFSLAMFILISIIVSTSLVILAWSFLAYRDIKTMTGAYVLDSPLLSGKQCSLGFEVHSNFSRARNLTLRAFSTQFFLWNENFRTITIPESPQMLRVAFQLMPVDRSLVSFSKCYARVSLPYHFGYLFFSIESIPELHAQVYPNTNIIFARAQYKGEPSQTFSRLEQSGGEGKEFDSFRKYTSGDDLRKVDWKQSAKGKGVLVKCYRAETHQRILVAIDCSRRMLAQVGERLQLEYAIDSAARLFSLATNNEDEIGLLGFAEDRQIITTCSSGRSHQKSLIKALLKLQCSELDANYNLVRQWAESQRRRSLIILITSLFHSSNIQDIGKCLRPVVPKHLPVVFSLSNTDLEVLSLSPAHSIDDAYASATATKMLKESQLLQKDLKHMGIDCQTCSALDLSKHLSNKYFQLKTSGRL